MDHILVITTILYQVSQLWCRSHHLPAPSDLSPPVSPTLLDPSSPTALPLTKEIPEKPIKNPKIREPKRLNPFFKDEDHWPISNKHLVEIVPFKSKPKASLAYILPKKKTKQNDIMFLESSESLENLSEDEFVDSSSDSDVDWKSGRIIVHTMKDYNKRKPTILERPVSNSIKNNKDQDLTERIEDLIKEYDVALVRDLLGNYLYREQNLDANPFPEGHEKNHSRQHTMNNQNNVPNDQNPTEESMEINPEALFLLNHDLKSQEVMNNVERYHHPYTDTNDEDNSLFYFNENNNGISNIDNNDEIEDQVTFKYISDDNSNGYIENELLNNNIATVEPFSLRNNENDFTDDKKHTHHHHHKNHHLHAAEENLLNDFEFNNNEDQRHHHKNLYKTEHKVDGSLESNSHHTKGYDDGTPKTDNSGHNKHYNEQEDNDNDTKTPKSVELLNELSHNLQHILEIIPNLHRGTHADSTDYININNSGFNENGSEIQNSEVNYSSFDDESQINLESSSETSLMFNTNYNGIQEFQVQIIDSEENNITSNSDTNESSSFDSVSNQSLTNSQQTDNSDANETLNSIDIGINALSRKSDPDEPNSTYSSSEYIENISKEENLVDVLENYKKSETSVGSAAIHIYGSENTDNHSSKEEDSVVSFNDIKADAGENDLLTTIEKILEDTEAENSLKIVPDCLIDDKECSYCDGRQKSYQLTFLFH